MQQDDDRAIRARLGKLNAGAHRPVVRPGAPTHRVGGREEQRVDNEPRDKRSSKTSETTLGLALSLALRSAPRRDGPLSQLVPPRRSRHAAKSPRSRRQVAPCCECCFVVRSAPKRTDLFHKANPPRSGRSRPDRRRGSS